MGQDKANAEFKVHGIGTDPPTYEWMVSSHWGDENVDESSTVTDAEATDLHDDAVTSQAAFNTTATTILSWYGFTTLSAANRTIMQATMRKACSRATPI